MYNIQNPKIPPHGIFANREPRAHLARHNILHNKLVEIVTDFVFHTHKQLDRTTIAELVSWSALESENPTEPQDS